MRFDSAAVECCTAIPFLSQSWRRSRLVLGEIKREPLHWLPIGRTKALNAKGPKAHYSKILASRIKDKTIIAQMFD